MIKLRTAAMLAAICVSGQVAWAGTPDYLNAGADYARAYHARETDNGVDTNGRCDGISYGTGARSCGTATGGPVGGNSSRN